MAREEEGFYLSVWKTVLLPPRHLYALEVKQITIRRFQYGISDLAIIDTIDREAFAEGSYRTHSIRQLLDLFQNLTFIAERDGESIGYILGGVDTKDPRSAWLLSIAVSPSSRGSGVAQLLLNRLFQELRGREDVETVLLTVDPKNSKARPLFEDWGWRVEARISDYFDVNDSRILMRKKI